MADDRRPLPLNRTLVSWITTQVPEHCVREMIEACWNYEPRCDLHDVSPDLEETLTALLRTGTWVGGLYSLDVERLWAAINWKTSEPECSTDCLRAAAFCCIAVLGGRLTPLGEPWMDATFCSWLVDICARLEDPELDIGVLQLTTDHLRARPACPDADALNVFAARLLLRQARARLAIVEASLLTRKAKSEGALRTSFLEQSAGLKEDLSALQVQVLRIVAAASEGPERRA